MRTSQILAATTALARLRHLGTALGLATVFASFGQVAAAQDYRLGAMDRVQVKVVEFNRDTLVPTEWTILSGDYRVTGEGSIMMPVIGEIVAQGLTLADLNVAIEVRVRDLIGFEKPAEGSTAEPADTTLTASTEIVEFRPFFVAGAIEAPGAYPYRPDLTVLQAVSIAGGNPAATGDGWSLERDAINANGMLRNLDAEQQMLTAQRLRLQAELENAADIVFPGDLQLPEQVKANEVTIFGRHQAEIRRQIESYGTQKTLLENEVASLNDQIEAQKKQGKLMAMELATVSSLVDKGLTTTSRRLTLDRAAADIESRLLQLQTSAIQVRQDITRCERELASLLDKRQNELAAELRDVDASLSETAEKRRTSLAMLARLQQSGSFATQTMLRPVYSIVRMDQRGAPLEMTDVAETTAVEPGDTIKVTMGVDDLRATLAPAAEIR